MGSSSEVHFSGFRIDDGLERRKGGAEQATTSATDSYKQTFLIGVLFFFFLCVTSCQFISHKITYLSVLELNDGAFTLSRVSCVSSRSLMYIEGALIIGKI